MSGTILAPTTTDLLHHRDIPAMSAVDTLFGLSADLWPILHRLASLVDIKHSLERAEMDSPNEKTTAMRSDFNSNTANIELLLHQWTPKTPTSMAAVDSPADDSRLQSILNNAEAYKQACLVFLYRDILSHSRSSPKVQGPAKQALQACLRVVIFSGPMATLLWPAFIAGAEAIEDADRSVARTVFKNLENRQGMSNIVTGWEVCEEIWRRQDTGDLEIGWREVAQQTGREVLFG
ncbi:hypothetical protein MMC19_005066 [Ptychographa xylographoides]|nr:hypothetical protein [Ptychographa xylographoides]